VIWRADFCVGEYAGGGAQGATGMDTASDINHQKPEKQAALPCVRLWIATGLRPRNDDAVSSFPEWRLPWKILLQSWL
jgi:hypothetical protein